MSGEGKDWPTPLNALSFFDPLNFFASFFRDNNNAAEDAASLERPSPARPFALLADWLSFAHCLSSVRTMCRKCAFHVSPAVQQNVPHRPDNNCHYN